MSALVVHVLQSVLQAAEEELREIAAKPDPSDAFRVGHVHGLVATANAIVKDVQAGGAAQALSAQSVAASAVIGASSFRPSNGYTINTAMLVDLLHDAARDVAKVEDFSDHEALEVAARGFEQLSADLSQLAAKVRFDHRAQRQANGKAKEKRA